jgi:hypothetical protein
MMNIKRGVEKKRRIVKTPLGVLLIILLGILLLASVQAQVGRGNQALIFFQDLNPTNVKATLLSQYPDPAQPGEIVEAKWKVENFGAGVVPNMRFILKPDFPFTIKPGESAEKNIGTLEARQIGKTSYVLDWALQVDEKAPEGKHNVGLYYLVGDVEVKAGEFPVEVRTRDSILMIDDVQVDPEKPRAGQEANVVITVRNLADSRINNLKVQLNLENTDFATVGSTSEKATKVLLPTAGKEIPFKLFVNTEAASKVHKIPVTLSFTDPDNQKHTVTSSFGVVVENLPEYVINLDKTEVYKKKQRGTVVLSISNIGKSDLNFVSMELQDTADYDVVSSAKMYLGNLESDDYESAEYTIYMHTEKKQVPLAVKLSYKDSFNQANSTMVQVPLKTYTSSEAKRYGLTKNEGSGLVGLLLIIIFCVWYVKRRKRIQFIAVMREDIKSIIKRIQKH